jgi:hypothetical protein
LGRSFITIVGHLTENFEVIGESSHSAVEANNIFENGFFFLNLGGVLGIVPESIQGLEFGDFL